MPSVKKKWTAALAAAVLLVFIWAIASQTGMGLAEREQEQGPSPEASTTFDGPALDAFLPLSPSPDALFIANILSAAKEVTAAELPDPPAGLIWDSSLYSQPGGGETLADLPAGGSFVVSPTGDPLWYSVTLEDGTAGYLYGDALGTLNSGGVSSRSLFQEHVSEKLSSLREQFPDGKYWNHMGQDIPWGDETPGIVTDIPCDHSAYGETYCNFYNGGMENLFSYGSLCECLGFASFLSDQLFGVDAPFYVFNDPKKLRVGDHIRLREYEHSMTVAAISEEGVTVAEVNQNYEDCRISWSRTVSWEELYGLQWDSEYISRYPLYPADEGGFTTWPEGSLP